MTHQAETTMHVDFGDGDQHDCMLSLGYEYTPGTPEVGAGYLADPRNYDAGSAPEIIITDIQINVNGVKHLAPDWLAALVRDDAMLEAFLIGEAEARK
jgi:hypothetical protein